MRIYGVGIQNRDEITKFIQANEITTEIFLDKDAKLMEALRVKYFPTKFLVQDGMVTNTWFGNSRNQAELFRQLGL